MSPIVLFLFLSIQIILGTSQAIEARFEKNYDVVSDPRILREKTVPAIVRLMLPRLFQFLAHIEFLNVFDAA